MGGHWVPIAGVRIEGATATIPLLYFSSPLAWPIPSSGYKSVWCESCVTDLLDNTHQALVFTFLFILASRCLYLIISQHRLVDSRAACTVTLACLSVPPALVGKMFSVSSGSVRCHLGRDAHA